LDKFGFSNFCIYLPKYKSYKNLIMKTKLLFVAAVLAVVSFSSCKKEYECVCTTGLGDPVTETHKGKDAKDACDDASSILQLKVCTPK
jgi:hypothetical protein